MSSLTTALGEALAIATRDKSTFERAEACYNAAFRSEPHSISELSEEDKEELIYQTKKAILQESGIYEPIAGFFADDEYDDDSYYSAIESAWDGYQESIDQLTINFNEDDLFCYLCNYKGEGEGIALYDAVKHLPIFRSKSDSFSHFGA